MLVLSCPTFTLPSVVAKTTSLCLRCGQVSAVTGLDCKNLLQMDFLSPHSKPSLYTNTMLSLCAMASLAESGENAIPRTTKFLTPSGCAGLVENLSLRSPFSSKSWTTLSVVTAAMRLEFGDLREWGRVRAGAVNLLHPNVGIGCPKDSFHPRRGEEGGDPGHHHVIAVTFLIPSSAWRMVFRYLSCIFPGHPRRGPQLALLGPHEI